MKNVICTVLFCLIGMLLSSCNTGADGANPSNKLQKNVISPILSEVHFIANNPGASKTITLDVKTDNVITKYNIEVAANSVNQDIETPITLNNGSAINGITVDAASAKQCIVYAHSQNDTKVARASIYYSLNCTGAYAVHALISNPYASKTIVLKNLNDNQEYFINIESNISNQDILIPGLKQDFAQDIKLEIVDENSSNCKIIDNKNIIRDSRYIDIDCTQSQLQIIVRSNYAHDLSIDLYNEKNEKNQIAITVPGNSMQHAISIRTAQMLSNGDFYKFNLNDKSAAMCNVYNQSGVVENLTTIINIDCFKAVTTNQPVIINVVFKQNEGDIVIKDKIRGEEEIISNQYLANKKVEILGKSKYLEYLPNNAPYSIGVMIGHNSQMRKCYFYDDKGQEYYREEANGTMSTKPVEITASCIKLDG